MLLGRGSLALLAVERRCGESVVHYAALYQQTLRRHGRHESLGSVIKVSHTMYCLEASFKSTARAHIFVFGTGDLESCTMT